MTPRPGSTGREAQPDAGHLARVCKHKHERGAVSPAPTAAGARTTPVTPASTFTLPAFFSSRGGKPRMRQVATLQDHGLPCSTPVLLGPPQRRTLFLVTVATSSRVLFLLSSTRGGVSKLDIFFVGVGRRRGRGVFCWRPSVVVGLSTTLHSGRHERLCGCFPALSSRWR